MSNFLDNSSALSESNHELALDHMFARLNNGSNATTEANPFSRLENEVDLDPTDDLPEGWSDVNQVNSSTPSTAPFFPITPATIEETGMTSVMIESLLLRYFYAKGEASIRECSRHAKLSYNVVQKIVKHLKDMHYIEFTSSDLSNDYRCRLTERGQDKGRRLVESSSYYGAAPVSLKDYIQAVHRQSIQTSHPDPTRLKEAFSDISVNELMLDRLGPAVNSGRGLFLFGPPGNGKTTIAERVSLAFGEKVWIPRSIFVDGEIIRVYDPLLHEEMPIRAEEGVDMSTVDHRWVRIKRPTVVVGGELTMKSLDITFNNGTGISEAPIQMKANCGVLVIDDFGRQQCSVDELLNRWIVPLEKRFDFLNTLFGKKICVPFDQLVIFSTNLEPRDLVDDAFLRRIPYKIEVGDPTPEEFAGVWNTILQKKNLKPNREVFDRLMSYYQEKKRPMRMCHARDILQQIENYCMYHRVPTHLTMHNLELAIANYFAIM